MKTLTSKIRLCKGINVDRNYINVLNYSESNMLALCESQTHLVASANDYSFIRNRGTISTSFTYDDALQSNYIAFQNKDYSNKWFFAWIDEVTYIGEKNTEIKYTVDVWSTWFSYWSVKPCFVEREHVNDDTIGVNTIPENLDVGEVIEENESYDFSYTTDFGFYIILATNWIIKDNSTGVISEINKGSQFSGVSMYNKNFSGIKLIAFKVTDIESVVSDIKNLILYISRTNTDGHIDDIQYMYIAPNASIPENYLTIHSAYAYTQDEDHEFYWYDLPYTFEDLHFNTIINKRTSFTDINVKNNKCFVYPYNYLFVSNNQGSYNIYKYEDFNSNTCIFKNELAMSIGISGRLIPKDYKGMLYNEDEALPLGKYPTCSWSSDAFTNWLTQNSVNIITQIANIPIQNVMGTLNNGISVAGQAMSGNAMGAIANGVTGTLNNSINTANQVAGLIGQFYQASLLPNITGGNCVGDVIWSSDKNMFMFREMRVKTEYLKIIDDYFTRFGYKINRVKIPNITGRIYWNYVQIGANEKIGYGDVPSNFMETINGACQKGVTIWHNHANIGNFNLNNTIVT